MKKWEIRRELLLKELEKEGKMTVEQIRDLLGISDSTVRRLIVELEQDSCLIRCFGGVQRIQPAAMEYSYAETEDENAASKIQIARTAAGLVENGDVLYLSGGSTVKYMAMELAHLLESRQLENISVITNSLVASGVLTDYTNVIMPGGVYRKKLQVLDGSLTEKNLRNMCFNKAFLGVVAVNEANGFMTADIETNSIIEVVLSKTSCFYVLADSSKFGRHSFISYGKINEAAGIITDHNLSGSVKESMENHGAVIITS